MYFFDIINKYKNLIIRGTYKGNFKGNLFKRRRLFESSLSIIRGFYF